MAKAPSLADYASLKETAQRMHLRAWYPQGPSVLDP
jgi:hypothetical protein